MSELALVCRTVVVAATRRSARARLRALSDRVPHVPADTDPYALAMARLGIAGPAPAERALRERLVRGGYRSRGVLADALLIALVETGVPVWATDDPGPLRLAPAGGGGDAGGGGVGGGGMGGGDAGVGGVGGGGMGGGDAGMGGVGAGGMGGGDVGGAAGLEVVGASLRVLVFTAPPRVSSSRVILFGLVVPGVALAAVEEAVWIASDIVAA